MNSKTQFTTKDGKAVDVATIKAQGAAARSAAFELRFSLGIFAIWCEENKKELKKEAPRLAKAAGLAPESIPPMASEGKLLVRNNATAKGLETFNRNVKSGKVTTADGLKAKAGVQSYAKHVAGQKVPKASGQPVVLDEAKANAAAAKATAKAGPAPERTHTTVTKGKDANRVTVTAPLRFGDTARANLLECLEELAAECGVKIIIPAPVNA
jgi:hypothetical protein